MSRARSSEPDCLQPQAGSGQTRAQSIVPPRRTPVRRMSRKPLCSLFAGHPQAPAGLGRARAGAARRPACGCPPGALRPRRSRRPRPLARRSPGPPARVPAPGGRRPAAAGLAGGSSLDLLGVGHLQPRERVAQRRELLRDAALEDPDQRPRGVDRVADLLEVLAAARPPAPPPPPAPACGRRG